MSHKERDEVGSGLQLKRRSLLQAAAAAAGGTLLGSVGSEVASAAAGFDDYRNYRAIEAGQGWDRGYRGRPDRSISLTDSGIDARHPDLGPWNGIRAIESQGDLVLTRPEDNDVTRVESGETESFSGTAGPGSFATGEELYHEFTAPADVDELDATLSWSPNADASNDLEFRLDKRVDGQWQTEARAATADMPEKLLQLGIEDGAEYRFVVELYVNTTTNYEISGTYYDIEGTVTTVDADEVFAGTGGDADADTPKTVGWFDAGSRYGLREKPRDPDGHGSHCSSIMGGSGRASTFDTANSSVDEPRTALSAVTGNYIDYEVDAEAGSSVFAAAYGELIELRVEDPSGQTIESATVVGGDASTNDINTLVAPAEQSGTYTVYVQTAEGETATAAYVDTIATGSFVDPDTTAGDRNGGSNSMHAGLAPDASLVGLQGLSAPTEDLGTHIGRFVEYFNIRAVNMSWGYVGGAPLGAAAGTLDRIPAVIKDIANGGVLTLAAAGNAATPANGNGSPAIAEEAVSVAATGPLDGLAAYSSGGIGAIDEDDMDTYMKPDLTAPGGTVTDLAQAALAGDADTPESEQAAIRGYTGKAGTSMATPFTTGSTGLVAQAMEEDAPASIALPEPTATSFDDVMRLKQVLLATATETAFTAAPYHRAHVPTYDFGGRDPYEGFGRVNVGAAIDAVTRNIEGASSQTVGLNVPWDERAVAGFVEAGPGTVDASVSFSHYSGGDKANAKGAPHIDLFVYDAENPADAGEPNILARSAGVQGDASASVSIGRNSEPKTLFVVAKLVNAPGAVNGDDVQAHLDLSVDVESGFFVDGTRADDGSTFTGGQTDQIDITVNPSETSEVRDVVPSDWTVITEHSDDVDRVEEDADTGVTYVYFTDDAAADSETSYTYFAEAPSEAVLSNASTFGPVEVNAGSGWVGVSGTSDTNVVVAQSTNL